MRRAIVGLLVGVLGLLPSAGSQAIRAVPASKIKPALGLHVHGRHLVNSRGQRVRLLGFNNSGAEYACIEGWGIFDIGDNVNTKVPTSDVVAMTRWHGVNAVRIQLNEQCWLGIGGVKPAYGGVRYQHTIEAYVRTLTRHGLAVILNLHLSAPGDEKSYNQEPMPDAHSIPFWHQVAAAFH
ncbi:MAG: hypothetical protein JO246_07595, partial [Frankiaceae bacterium]|nr:hypothetical protein [Frankiaceae bacterium]